MRSPLLVQLIKLCLLVGCGVSKGGTSTGSSSANTNTPPPNPWDDGTSPPWYMPAPPITNITPSAGSYNFVPNSTVGLDGREAFSVVEISGKKYVRFTSDSYRFDEVEIINGTFTILWGLGIGSWPTDAYAITGSFISSSRADGRYKYAGGHTTIQGRTIFSAGLQN